MPTQEEKQLVLDRMHRTFELCLLAEKMKRQSLLRRYPEATEEEIDRLLQEWWLARPGAEEGDGPGRPVPKERLEKWRSARSKTR